MTSEGNAPTAPLPPADIDRRAFLRRAAVGAALASAGTWAGASTGKRPNIIFFLADDMGWRDCQTYGSTYYDTPNIARLAKQSMRFTDAYAASPLCSPTRASILTGKHPARLHLTSPEGHLPAEADAPEFPASGPAHQRMLTPRTRRFLPLEERTIGEAMKDLGYRTGFIGKWHLGVEEKYWPQAQGFDVNIGGGPWPGPPSYHAPYHISNLPDGPDGEYITDRLTDEAEEFLDAKGEEPFFLCLWHYAVHAPYQAKESITETFRDKEDPQGLQENPIMASMIKSMDDSLGRVLDKVEELGVQDDTIIVFFSDNGGNEYDRVGPEAWSPTNNDPLRSGKGAIYEGGIRVPMMVCWPGVAPPDTESSVLVSSVDFYPTLLGMAGAGPQPDAVLDGEDLAPVLRGTGTVLRDGVFCHFPHRNAVPCQPASTVRAGDWKLIHVYETNEDFPTEYELYNLREDIGETNNLAGTMPEKVRELNALLDRFLEETDAAVPIPNPAYDPNALLNARGWRGSGHTRLSLGNGTLRVHSTGQDPYIYTPEVPEVAGPLVLKMRFRSEAGGGGMFFWSTEQAPAFGPNRRLPFTPSHDGLWHEYAVSFSCDGDLAALRADPCTAPGLVEFDWIRLCKEDGTLIKAWDFE